MSYSSLDHCKIPSGLIIYHTRRLTTLGSQIRKHGYSLYKLSLEHDTYEEGKDLFKVKQSNHYPSCNFKYTKVFKYDESVREEGDKYIRKLIYKLACVRKLEDRRDGALEGLTQFNYVHKMCKMKKKLNSIYIPKRGRDNIEGLLKALQVVKIIENIWFLVDFNPWNIVDSFPNLLNSMRRRQKLSSKHVQSLRLVATASNQRMKEHFLDALEILRDIVRFKPENMKLSLSINIGFDEECLSEFNQIMSQTSDFIGLGFEINEDSEFSLLSEAIKYSKDNMESISLIINDMHDEEDEDQSKNPNDYWIIFDTLKDLYNLTYLTIDMKNIYPKFSAGIIRMVGILNQLKSLKITFQEEIDVHKELLQNLKTTLMNLDKLESLQLFFKATKVGTDVTNEFQDVLNSISGLRQLKSLSLLQCTIDEYLNGEGFLINFDSFSKLINLRSLEFWLSKNAIANHNIHNFSSALEQLNNLEEIKLDFARNLNVKLETWLNLIHSFGELKNLIKAKVWIHNATKNDDLVLQIERMRSKFRCGVNLSIINTNRLN